MRAGQGAVILGLFGVCMSASPAAAGRYVYVEVFCNNPLEVPADARPPDKNAPKLMSDPPRPPLVCTYYSNVVFAGQYQPLEFAREGKGRPAEEIAEEARIKAEASTSFDTSGGERPCRYKTVKVVGMSESRDEVQRIRDKFIETSRANRQCVGTFEILY